MTGTGRVTTTTTPLRRADHYDAVIVGARAAGAATALQLAKRGLRVLAIDRSGYGSDTLSSHALMRGAVTQLERWGLAEELRAQTASITAMSFHYGDQVMELDLTGGGATSPLMAPRRTVLDRVLVDAARHAGAEVRHHTKLVSIATNPLGHVTGIEIEANDVAGPHAKAPVASRHISTELLIGADGLNSTVARQLDVPVTRMGQEASAYVLRYLDDLDLDRVGYHWLYEHNVAAGVIPTGTNQHAVFAAMPRQRFRNEIRADATAGFDRVLHEVNPEVADAARRAKPAGPVRSWPGRVGQFRQPTGPGWALVGDAGYFKDPFAAHGISDALRDAELLADAVISGDYSTYGRLRDELSSPLFDVLEDIASYRWTLDELAKTHYRLSKAMAAENETLAQLRAAVPERLAA